VSSSSSASTLRWFEKKSRTAPVAVSPIPWIDGNSPAIPASRNASMVEKVFAKTDAVVSPT